VFSVSDFEVTSVFWIPRGAEKRNQEIANLEIEFRNRKGG
jgi:hypothetical protein